MELPDSVRRLDIDTADVSAFSDAPLTDVDRVGAAESVEYGVRHLHLRFDRPVRKGVAGLTHRAIVNQQLWMLQASTSWIRRMWCCRRPQPPSTCRCGGYFLPLLVGRARLIVATPDGHRDPFYVASAIEQHGCHGDRLRAFDVDRVFVANATAGAMSTRCVHVFVIGEALPPETAAGFRAPQCCGGCTTCTARPRPPSA